MLWVTWGEDSLTRFQRGALHCSFLCSLILFLKLFCLLFHAGNTAAHSFHLPFSSLFFFSLPLWMMEHEYFQKHKIYKQNLDLCNTSSFASVSHELAGLCEFSARDRQRCSSPVFSPQASLRGSFLQNTVCKQGRIDTNTYILLCLWYPKYQHIVAQHYQNKIRNDDWINWYAIMCVTHKVLNM